MKIVRIQTKLLRSILLACCLIILSVSLVELFQHRKFQKNQISTEFANFDRGAKQVIREAVWRYDWDMVQTILKTQTSQMISFVEICDDKASKCLTYGDRGRIPYIEYETEITYNEVGSNNQVPIGRIYLQGHYDTWLSHLQEDLPSLLLTNGLSVFGVALILFFLFHRQVVQRLIALEKYTRQIDLQEGGEKHQPGPETLPEGQKRDEIHLLGDAVCGLVERAQGELERRKLLEQQLQQAQKMEALGTLAGGIAHDFNNILAAILGFAELSHLESEPGSRLHRNLGKIINAGQRAKNLISQILVFSRRTESPQEVLILADVVDEALTLIRASLPPKIVIHSELDRNIKVRGDSTRLHQIIMNLMTNGVQALGNGGGEITVSLQQLVLTGKEADSLVLESGKYCCLVVRDDGPGIPEAIQTRIFDPFFTTKKTGKGTGMGLAVVHGIVQNHGGTITVESRQGEGARFSIYLPQTDRKVAKNEHVLDVPKGTGQHVIVVDDEAVVLNLGTEVLADLGYKVKGFNSPVSARAYLETKPRVDLLITDLTMPEMSGLELATEFRLVLPDLPILLWTGYRDELAESSLDRHQVSQILEKPFEVEVLAQKVHALLK